MLDIDFSLAIALFICLFLGIVLLVWLLARDKKEKDLALDPKFIWFCSVCTYTYVNTKEDLISACPRCGSYNKRDNKEDTGSRKPK